MESFTTLITCHDSPDFDAIGSMVAASKLHPNSVMLWPGSRDKELNTYVEKKKEQLKLHLVFNLVKFPKNQFTKVVIVDTAKSTRIKHLGEYLDKCEKKEVDVWVYDHHDPIEEQDLKVEKKEQVFVHSWGSACSVIVNEIKKHNQKNPESKEEKEN